jgi:type II secretory pathway component PulF
VIETSHFFMAYWYILIALAVAGVSFLIASLRVYAVRYVFDSFILKVPVFGEGIFHKFLISRYCGTMATLLSGGVPLSKSLQIVSRVVNHTVMQKSIEKVLHKVVGGAMIADVMRTQPIFTRLSVKMVSVGEKTGRLPEMLQRTADYYDEELDNLIQKLSVLIEPGMIAVVGGFIGLIVVSLYLPIFSIVKLVK